MADYGPEYGGVDIRLTREKWQDLPKRLKIAMREEPG
jgi:hypothetical protein